MKGTPVISPERQREREELGKPLREKKRTNHGLKVSLARTPLKKKKERKNCKESWINRYEEEER